MSRVEMAVEKVRRLNEKQAEALLDWLELRENPKALRDRLDKEIDSGLQQLKKGQKISSAEVHGEIRKRSQQRRAS
jgi:hypothetical protein